MQISVYRNNMPVETFESTPGTLQSFKIVPVSGSNTVIKLAIPLIDIHSFWYSNCNEFHVQLVWRLNFTCALNHNMPYLAFFNLARQLRCAVATDDLVDDTNFSGAMNQRCLPPTAQAFRRDKDSLSQLPVRRLQIRPF